MIDHYVHAARWEIESADRAVTDWDVMRGFEEHNTMTFQIISPVDGSLYAEREATPLTPRAAAAGARAAQPAWQHGRFKSASHVTRAAETCARERHPVTQPLADGRPMAVANGMWNAPPGWRKTPRCAGAIEIEDRPGFLRRRTCACWRRFWHSAMELP